MTLNTSVPSKLELNNSEGREMLSNRVEGIENASVLMKSASLVLKDNSIRVAKQAVRSFFSKNERKKKSILL